MKPINEQIAYAEERGHNHFLIATDYWMILVSSRKPRTGSSWFSFCDRNTSWEEKAGSSYHQLTTNKVCMNVFGDNERRLLIDSWVE